jgi:F420-non-reducing hydrogenase iron-sulfur subunit
MADWEPKIVSFLCNWCSYGAADLAGVSRMQYPATTRVVRIPCTGRMSPKFALAALREGADAVWVSGWHPGECHYLEGNYYARRKFVLMKNLLELMGVEPDRIHFSWISSAESTKFVKVVSEIAEKVKKLGPNKHFVKQEAKVA